MSHTVQTIFGNVSESKVFHVLTEAKTVYIETITYI